MSCIHGSKLLKDAYEKLHDLYLAEGLTESEIAELVILDIKEQKYFTDRGYKDQHMGGQAFAKDESIMSPEDERYSRVADEIYELREQKRRVLLDEANRDTAAKRVEELVEFIRGQNGELVEYDEGLVRKLIEKVIVYVEQIRVVFKSGLEVDVDS